MNVGGSNNEAVRLEFAQLPHKPIAVRGTFTGDGGTADTTYTTGNTYQFRVHEYGEIDGTCDAGTVGEEFNPLNEIDKYGRENPY